MTCLEATSWRIDQQVSLAGTDCLWACLCSSTGVSLTGGRAAHGPGLARFLHAVERFDAWSAFQDVGCLKFVVAMPES